MNREQQPFWKEDWWHDGAKYTIRMNDIAGQDWWVARFVLRNRELKPEELFFHTCTDTEKYAHAWTGACATCGENIPMKYLKRAMFIDRMFCV